MTDDMYGHRPPGHIKKGVDELDKLSQKPIKELSFGHPWGESKSAKTENRLVISYRVSIKKSFDFKPLANVLIRELFLSFLFNRGSA
jgi:hypothetical protein